MLPTSKGIDMIVSPPAEGSVGSTHEIGSARRFPRPEVLPRPIGGVAPIARLIGPEAALKLVERRGGTRLYVPRKDCGNNKTFNALVGIDVAGAIIDHYSGCIIKVPLGREWRIHVYHEAGLSYADIAVLLSISESTVHRVLQIVGATDASRSMADAVAARRRRRAEADKVARIGDFPPEGDQTAKNGHLILDKLCGEFRRALADCGEGGDDQAAKIGDLKGDGRE